MDTSDEKHQKYWDEEREHPKPAVGFAATYRPACSFIFAANRLQDGVDTGHETCLVLARFEARRDLIFHYALCQRVGQRPLQTRTKFDTEPAILSEYQQQHAVVLLLLPNLPGAIQAIGVIFN